MVAHQPYDASADLRRGAAAAVGMRSPSGRPGRDLLRRPFAPKYCCRPSIRRSWRLISSRRSGRPRAPQNTVDVADSDERGPRRFATAAHVCAVGGVSCSARRVSLGTSRRDTRHTAMSSGPKAYARRRLRPHRTDCAALARGSTVGRTAPAAARASAAIRRRQRRQLLLLRSAAVPAPLPGANWQLANEERELCEA